MIPAMVKADNFSGLPLNHFLTIPERVRVITPRGIFFTADAKENLESDKHPDDHNGRFCGVCNKSLKGKQQALCSIGCVNTKRAAAAMEARKDKLKKYPEYKKCPVCHQVKAFLNNNQRTCSKICGGKLKWINRKLNIELRKQQENQGENS